MEVTFVEAQPSVASLRLDELKEGDFFEVIEPTYRSKGIIIQDADGGLSIVRLTGDARVYATPMSETRCGHHAVHRLPRGTTITLEAE